MEIRNHETSPTNIVIVNPTADAVKLAKEMEKGGWAKFRPNGDIVAVAVRRREFNALLPKEPVAKPVFVPPTNEELEARIVECEAEIVRLEALRNEWSEKRDFDLAAEADVQIGINEARIENHRKRIAGIPLYTVTEEEVALMDYVLSDKYNDD